MPRKKQAKSARAKRTKLAPIPSLIKKLDRIFSRWVRLRDSCVNGLCQCVTCGKVAPIAEMHAGHFVKRQHMAIRFDPRNCHAQCVKCNLYMGGCQDEYAAFIVNTYGQAALDDLLRLKRTAHKWTREDLQDLCVKYQTSARELEARISSV
jgi:hypothetical protein